LKKIILSLTRDELRELKYFIEGREKVHDEREDISLIERIRKGEAEVPLNANAYHQTRRRVKKQLELFIQHNNVSTDMGSQIRNEVEVAGFLFNKGLYDEAWFYLNKAEKAALATEEYALLGYIYDRQVYYAMDTWSLKEPSVVIPELLEKRALTSRLTQNESDANAAYLLVLSEVSELFDKNVYGDIDAITHSILHKYNLQNQIYDNPKTYVKVVNIICRALREKKDYRSLRQYAFNSYNVIKTKNMLKKTPDDFLMDLLRSVFISCIRTKDYKAAVKHLEVYKYHKERFGSQHNKYVFFDFRYKVMFFNLSVATNNFREGANVLSSLFKNNTLENSSIVIRFIGRRNLFFMSYIDGDYEACLKIHSDLLQHWGKNVLKAEGTGLEALMFAEISAAMVHYETGDEEYALYLLSRVRRKYFNSAAKKSTLHREVKFVQIFEKLIKDELYKTSKNFKEDVKQFVMLKEYIPGDKEDVSLNAWLNSKLTGREYYECHIEACK
jgi:hypothetical protein